MYVRDGVKMDLLQHTSTEKNALLAGSKPLLNEI